MPNRTMTRPVEAIARASGRTVTGERRRCGRHTLHLAVEDRDGAYVWIYDDGVPLGLDPQWFPTAAAALHYADRRCWPIALG